MLDDFGGSQAMAAAAYNAGPSRPRRWRDGPLIEPAVWAENIPFNETRDYVKKVLSNTVYYRPAGWQADLPEGKAGPTDRASRRTGAGIGQRVAVNKPKRVLVLGGTGFVGRSVCERLVAHGGGAGTRITVPTRRLAHAKSVQFLPTVDPLECDVHDDAQLARALAGQDAVVNLIAILHGTEAAFEQVHVRLAQRLAAACAAAGVRRVVHVSALGVSADAPSNYLRSKAKAEAVLRAAPLDLTVLRPSVIFGAGDSFLNLFAALQSVFPVMPLAGVSARFQPVWVEDVAEAIVRCLERQDTAAKIFECAGPQVFTLGELVRLAGRLSGHDRPLMRCPTPWGGCRPGPWRCCRARH